MCLVYAWCICVRHLTQPQPLRYRRVRGGCEGAYGVRVVHLAQPQLLSNEQWRLLLLLVIVVVLLLLLQRRTPLRLRYALLAAPITAVVLEHLCLVVLCQQFLQRVWNGMPRRVRVCEGV